MQFFPYAHFGGFRNRRSKAFKTWGWFYDRGAKYSGADISHNISSCTIFLSSNNVLFSFQIDATCNSNFCILTDEFIRLVRWCTGIKSITDRYIFA